MTTITPNERAAMLLATTTDPLQAAVLNARIRTGDHRISLGGVGTVELVDYSLDDGWSIPLATGLTRDGAVAFLNGWSGAQ